MSEGDGLRLSRQLFARSAQRIAIMTHYLAEQRPLPESSSFARKTAEPIGADADGKVRVVPTDEAARRRDDEDAIETSLGLLTSRSLVEIRAAIPVEERISGSFVGSAIGDALAAPTEFLTVDAILKRWPPIGPTKLTKDHCSITDDTQMAMAVGRAIVRCESPESSTHIAAALAHEFVGWLRDPENNRAPGNTCIQATRALEAGKSWLNATVAASKGCGANMRVHPVAYRWWSAEDDRQRSRVSQLQAAVTHGHPTALATSDLTSYAIALLLRGVPVHQILERLIAYASDPPLYDESWLGELWQKYGAASPSTYAAEGWSEALAALKRVEVALLDNDGFSDPCVSCGDGWIAEEALATGLFCFLGHCWDTMGASEALRRAAVTRGDSDSIACLAGAFAGACDGVLTWPASWRRILEHHTELMELSARLSSARV